MKTAHNRLVFLGRLRRIGKRDERIILADEDIDKAPNTNLVLMHRENSIKHTRLLRTTPDLKQSAWILLPEL